MDEHVADAVGKGASLVLGGERLTGEQYDAGTFFAPTVLTDVTPEMLIYREETFGPIAPVILFDDEDEVIQMANDTDYGLAAYLYTKDLSRAIRVSEALRFAIVGDQRHQPDLRGGAVRRHEGKRPGPRRRPGRHRRVPGDQAHRHQRRIPRPVTARPGTARPVTARPLTAPRRPRRPRAPSVMK